jgi:hypothetical protein
MIHAFTKKFCRFPPALAALGAAPLPALSQPATQNVVEPYADLVELADRHLWWRWQRCKR